MDGFTRCITKMAVISGIALVVILPIITGVLLSVPQLLLQIIYYALILGCVVGTGYILFCLFRMLVALMRWKCRKGRSGL